MIHDQMAQQGLVRPEQDRVLAGVCAGLGRRFGLDPWPTRLLFILILMILPGSQILIYPVLWILMPSERALRGPQPYQQRPYQPYPTQQTYQPYPTQQP
ncbi:PspC domain-containing protein [Isoptericola sp. b441]|uniref:PspC domain-containing protein n=1 Tax=Actinotalea lenta TaxID=3064654 RepID=A0ABT9DDH6_9CELL|nr:MULTISPECIES: PspC domain-containing protein [unclassified Isoptericola]MDO8107456.1 PspC domain-containing protein [Isoptericola sp. b441]MDO8120883.1 PspC domain-containing protein [Isoptericola sp. b490]